MKTLSKQIKNDLKTKTPEQILNLLIDKLRGTNMTDKPYMDEHQLLNARIDDISKQNAEILQEVMNTQKLHIGVDLILKKIKEQDYALSILNKKLDVLNYTFDNFIRCVNETKDNSRQILKEMKIADT